MRSEPELIASIKSPGFACERWPLFGSGHSAERFRSLLQLGQTDLSLARIAEAHADALAIMAESDHIPRSEALYGVWASDGPKSHLVAERVSDVEWQLNGTKQYCSGATFVSAALVTAHVGDSVVLFDVSMKESGIRVLPSNWETPAMSDTATAPVAFENVAVLSSRQVGDAGWYLRRPGFWHGAIAPAACWAGGALSLIEAAAALGRRDAHSRAHVGALLAHAWSLSAWFDQAGREIDADPTDRSRQARVRALKVRHLVERTCTDVLDRFGRATGPQLLGFDAHVARQHMALALYIRQCHAERDLETIPQ